MEKSVELNPYWREFLLENYSVIKSWVQFNKAQFLQDRNPGVPGIIYKLCRPDNVDARKLEHVRKLWNMTVEITGNNLIEIYTGNKISINEMSIDHFIPRSYVSNDELWNLIPMNKNLNSSKNNKLPEWDKFFTPFAQYQFYLYDLIFPTDKNMKKEKLISIFEKCRKNNINSIWATENLYVQGNSKQQFFNILEHNLHPIYDAAKQQGFDMWIVT